MRTLLIILLTTLCFSMARGQAPSDTGQLRQKINEWIVPNGNKAITAQQVNALFNGVLNLMKAYAVDSGYVIPNTDTFVLVRRGGFSSYKIKLPAGSSGGVEVDPTVPSVVKGISSTNINDWNAKQPALSTGSGVFINNNKIQARKDSAIWNANSLQGNPVSNTAPTNGQVLKWNGTAWAPAPCGCDAVSTLAISTQPTNQTVDEGNNTGFTVALTGGTTPYSYQWQFNNGSGFTNISGATSATYNVINATSANAGSYRVNGTDAASGTVTSNTATLTVNGTSSISIQRGYSSTNPFIDNSTAPTISNASSFTIASGANISFSLPFGAADKYWVIKEPSDQPVKTTWYHNTDNSGPIPGDVVRVWTVGSFRYYSSISEFVLTYTDPIELRHP